MLDNGKSCSTGTILTTSEIAVRRFGKHYVFWPIILYVLSFPMTNLTHKRISYYFFKQKLHNLEMDIPLATIQICRFNTMEFINIRGKLI